MNNRLSVLIAEHQSTITDEPRDYIGASIIGSDCLRQIWYEYKGYKVNEVSDATRRNWAIGKKLEGLMIEWLEDASVGVVITDRTFTSTKAPYFQGHIDAVVIFGTTSAILEIKTAKNSSFNTFVNKGLQAWSPQYYAQVQTYMGMSGIHQAIILVLNKDNSCLSDEFIAFDEDYYQRLEEKAKMIADAVIEPPRVNSSPLWYQCKGCKFNKICHQAKE